MIEIKNGSYRAASNYTLQWTSYFFQSFNSPACHSARRASEELQNPLPHEWSENNVPKEMVLSMEDEGRGKGGFLGAQP